MLTSTHFNLEKDTTNLTSRCGRVCPVAAWLSKMVCERPLAISSAQKQKQLKKSTLGLLWTSGTLPSPPPSDSATNSPKARYLSGIELRRRANAHSVQRISTVSKLYAPPSVYIRPSWTHTVPHEAPMIVFFVCLIYIILSIFVMVNVK